MPAVGGTPSQLTPEPGTYFFPRISKDAKRLVYIKESRISNLWSVSLETKEMNQITFEDGTFWHPEYSPDGKRILYQRRGELFICNSDGSEPIQASNENRHVADVQPRWSGDGKVIAYTVWRRDTVSTKPDSVEGNFIIKVKNLSENYVKEIGKGALTDWSSDGKYLIFHPKTDETYRKYILSLTTSVDKPIKEIESKQFPSFSHDSKNVIYADSVYLWSLSVDNGQVNRLRKLPKDFRGTRETSDGKSIFGYTWNKNRKKNVFARLSKTGTQVEELFEMESIQPWASSISPDMKAVVLSGGIVQGNKIVLVDHFR